MADDETTRRGRGHLRLVDDPDQAKRGRGRPGKSLQQHVDDGSFERRKHELLLETDEFVDDAQLRKLQQRYRRLRSDDKRRDVALEFERLVRGEAPERATKSLAEFQVKLERLGKPGSAEQVVNFGEAFVVWDDGQPMRMDPWQKEIVHEAYRRRRIDRQWRRVYKEILVGICRGQGKTPLASLLGTHGISTAHERTRVYQIAGSKAQAGIGTEYATNWVEDSDLSMWLRARAKSIVRKDGRGYYVVVSSEGRLAHGKHGRMVAIADELWGFKDASQEQSYVAFESALFKNPESFLIAISTAGYDLTSLLGRKYRRGLACPKVETRREGFLTIGRDVANGYLMWWYGMPDGYDLDLEDDKAVLRALKLANPGSWTDHRELLRSLRRAMLGDAGENDAAQDELEWLRLHLNFWTKARGAWLKVGAWRALADDTVEIPRGAPICVAVDAAHSYDTTAVSWAWLSPDGRVVVRCRVFSVRAAAPAHDYPDEFYDAGMNEHVAERFIHELARDYRVREVVADPNYFRDELARLGRRFRTAPIYPASKEMREYVQGFYREAHARTLVHNGDGVVTAHVEAIAGEKERHTGYWVIRQLNQSSPIDAGTAQIIAVGRCRDRRDVSVYNERGLDVIETKAPADPDSDESSTSQAIAYSPELARLLGLDVDDPETNDEDPDDEEDEPWDDD